jgi:membrane-bound ClpP family serine protease
MLGLLFGRSPVVAAILGIAGVVLVVAGLMLANYVLAAIGAIAMVRGGIRFARHGR